MNSHTHVVPRAGHSFTCTAHVDFDTIALSYPDYLYNYIDEPQVRSMYFWHSVNPTHKDSPSTLQRSAKILFVARAGHINPAVNNPPQVLTQRMFAACFIGVTYAITVSATPPGVIAQVPTSFQGAGGSNATAARLRLPLTKPIIALWSPQVAAVLLFRCCSSYQINPIQTASHCPDGSCGPSIASFASHSLSL